MEDFKLKLIECIKPLPQLYVSEDYFKNYTTRAHKQKLWDNIAKQCGFEKTEEAKLKWRLLVNYFRQHLNNVAHRKLRRYVPNTNNPNDKYVQLNDWKYYQHMAFMRPYVRLCKCRMCASDASVNRNGTEANATNENENENTLRSATTESSNEINAENMTIDISVQPTVGSGSRVTLQQLSENEKNLKDFFDLMLRSTQKLPLYHQERVKLKLTETLDMQKQIL